MDRLTGKPDGVLSQRSGARRQHDSVRYAAIDVGSNTVRLLVADVSPDRRLREITDVSRMTRLGKGLAVGGDFDPQALQDTLDAVREFAGRARDESAQRLFCLATAAVRERQQGAGIAALQDAAGVSPWVLSGDEEARLAYVGALAAAPRVEGSVAVVDIGGGSTEIATGSGSSAPCQHISIALGARRATERFLCGDPPAPASLEALRAAVGRVWTHSAITSLVDADRLVGVGGTVTTLGELVFGTGKRAAGMSLSVADIEAQIAAFSRRNAAEARSALPWDPDRSEVIVAGGVIIYELLRMASKREIIVSYGGVRHGALVTASSGPE